MVSYTLSALSRNGFFLYTHARRLACTLSTLWSLRVAMLLALPLWLTACAVPQKIGGTEPGFERAGRFSVTVEEADGQIESVQGGFAWHDTGQLLQLNLANPLGSTLARLEVQPSQVVLTRADGSRETAPSPEALVARILGGPLPVTGLRQWLQGKVNTASAQNLQKNSQGQIEAFEQLGWQVQLQRYDEQGPARLNLRRSDTGRTIRVRLLIDS